MSGDAEGTRGGKAAVTWWPLTPSSSSSSISAQSNFAVGAVVNATFGSITELTFYITALIKGSREGNRCYAEVVKSALTGTLVGCVLFVPVRRAGTRAAAPCGEVGGCKAATGVCWGGVALCPPGSVHGHRGHPAPGAAVQQPLGRRQLGPALPLRGR